GNQRQDCGTSKPLSNPLCAGFVVPGATSARIEIRMRGYKIYTVNVPKLTFTNNIAEVNIGELFLTKTDLPAVKRVIASRGRNGSQAFEITLENKLPRNVLITDIQVKAERPGIGAKCLLLGTESGVYEIANTLTVTGGGSGEMGVAGEYREKS